MLDNSTLRRLEKHWAISAIPETERKSVFEYIKKSRVQKSIGKEINFNFKFQKELKDEVEKIALAYEIPAIENINCYTNITDEKCDYDIFIASAWKCFELYNYMDIPEEFNRKFYFVLHLCSLAYCGERWNDLRTWFNENYEKIYKGAEENSNDDWGTKLLKTLYRCWILLFMKRDWNDLDSISQSVFKLRSMQGIYECEYLDESWDTQYAAMILIALYHLAKCTEILATYVMQGEPNTIHAQLDKHFEAAIESAMRCRDTELETILRWLHCASKQMIESSIWWIARAINSRTTDFVKYVTKNRNLFEMLPPQKAAIREQGLLDQAATAIAVELPTSGGKTLLAEFKILQALNQFDADKGWVAYVAPTKALVSQITRRLRKDFNNKIRVEQLSSAVEIDAFENELLIDKERVFDVLIATPEKLNLVIKNNKVSRPLALIVMDEAQNIEDDERGLRIELLLSTVKADCPTANFMLLMPYVENADVLARWLSADRASGKSISISGTPWQPNERLVGIYDKKKGDKRGDWEVNFETLITTPQTIHFDGIYSVGNNRPFGLTYSRANKSVTTSAMASSLFSRGTCLAIGRTQYDSWNIARNLQSEFDNLEIIPEQIKLVQKYLSDEIGENFELIKMLSKGIGVHNAGLSDDIKELMEWLAEEDCLRVLCATTTIAQGINFPVSSVCLQSISHPSSKGSKDMSPREFWNLAGRAGRIGQNDIGIVGIAVDNNDKDKIKSFVSQKTGALISRLVTLMNDLEKTGNLLNLEKVIYTDAWTDFRCYIAHLCNKKEELDDVINDMEQLLRYTYGYNAVKTTSNGYIKSKQLLMVTKQYAERLLEKPHISKLADQTGFSPEGVNKALSEIGNLKRKLTVKTFNSKSIFNNGSALSDLYGIMLKLPQLKQLEEIAGDGITHEKIAKITTDWVSGLSIYEIAQRYFAGEDDTKSITNACKAINKQITNYGTWGLSTITKLSGIDYDNLTVEQKREIDILPAMIYHGVYTTEAVLMRMNSVPRSISYKMGEKYKEVAKEYTIYEAKQFIKSLNDEDWDKLRKRDSNMSGNDYKMIWKLFSGE